MSEISYEEITISKIVPDIPLPGDIYVCVNEKHIKFMPSGESLPRKKFDFFISKNVRCLYTTPSEYPLFLDWFKKEKEEVIKKMVESVGEDQRPVVEQMYEVSTKVVDALTIEEMSAEQFEDLQNNAANFIEKVGKYKTTLSTIAKLTKFSQNLADHSINVANLSVFMAIALGNDHSLVLENIYMGALFHDFGKAKKKNFEILEDPNHKEYEETLHRHPIEGANIITKSKSVPPQVISIMMEHHENYDGSGYPRGMKGGEIYNLTRIVSICNFVDKRLAEVAEEKGEGEAYTIVFKEIEEDNGKMFDPKLAETCLAVLRKAFA